MINQNQKTVLIVSDNTETRQMLRVIFRRAKYRVLTASDEDQGFRSAQNDRLDLITGDVSMSAAGEFCRRVRADEKLRSLPILLIGESDKDVWSAPEALKTDADDYLTLPTDPPYLIARAELLVERRRAEDLLRESENRFHSVIDNVSDVISIILPDGTILFESPSLEQVVGFKPEQVIGKNVFDSVHKDDKERVVDFFKTNMRVNATTAPVEYRFRNSVGDWLVIESVGKFIDDSTKGLVAVINSRDITERRRTEELIRQSEEKYRTILESSEEGYYEIDLAGNYTFFNNVLCRSLGYDRDEMTGMNYRRYTDAETAKKLFTLFNGIYNTGQPLARAVYEVIRKDGTRRIHETSGSLIRGAGGEPVGFRGIMRDVTERQRIENNLRESEERYRIFVAQSSEAIWRFETEPPCPVDISVDEQIDWLYRCGYLAECNDAMARMYGYEKAEEITGARTGDLMPRSDAANVEYLRAFIRSGYKLADADSHEIDKDGNPLIFSNSLSGVVENNLVMRVWGVQRDITEQRRTESELRRSEANLAAAQRITHLGSWEVVLSDLRRINNNKVHWSDEVYRIFGYEPGRIDVSINRYFDSIHPDDRRYCRRAFAEAVTDGKDLNIEFRIRPPGGGERILHGLAEVIYDEQTGKPLKFIGTVQDITKRKLAEQILESSESRLRKQNKVLTELTGRHTLFYTSLEEAINEITEITARTLDTARVGVWLYADNKTKIRAFDLYEADSKLHSKGLEISETGYPSYFKALAEDPAIVVDDARKDTRTREFTESYLVPLGITSMLDVPIRLGGQTIGVICHEHVADARRWKLDEQNFAGSMADLISLLFESNERRQAEEALNDSQRQYESLVHSVDGIVWEMDARTFHVTFISRQSERLLGYKPEQLIGASDFWASHIFADDRARVTDSLVEAVKKRSETEFDYRMTNADGRVVWLRTFVSVDVFDGEAKCLRGIAVDITDRKLADEALKQSERDYRAIFEQAHDAIIIFVPESEIILEVNRRACELYGFSRSEFIGMSIETISKNPANGKDKVKQTREMGEYLNFETVQYRKDGSEMFLEVNASTIKYQGSEAIITINRDITERKTAADELRKSLSLLTSTFEATADGIAVYDSEFNIVNYNNKFLEMWRIAEDAVKGRNNAETMPTILDQLADPTQFLERVKQLQSNLDESYSDIIEFKDGRIYERFIKPQILEGKVIGQVLSFRDITERRQAERDISFQAHLLDTVEQAVIASDLEGVVIYWNQFAQKIYGWSAEEAVDRKIMDLTKPETSPSQVREIMSRVREGRGWSGEVVVTRKDGTAFPASVTNSPVFNDRGAVIGMVGISQNISERKRAEQALVEANERAIREYERLLDRIAELAESLGTARDLLTIYRALYSFAVVSVPCTGFFVSLYDAKRNVRLPGYARSDGEEIDISSLPPMEMAGSPNSRAIMTGTVIIEDDFQAAMAGKPIINVGLDKNPDLPQSCLIAPMAVMGRVVGTVEAQTYATAAYTKEHATAMRMAANLAANAVENVRLLQQEHEREEQLRQSQKLESVGRLAGGIAHDFNNMLTAISGYSELTLRHLDTDNPLRRNVEEIKKASERSAALTHQLLAFSRRQVLQSKIFNLNEVINDTIRMFRRLIGENINLDAALDTKLGRVEADPGQMTQVLMNLVVNARDAMPEGGSLTIKTVNVEVDENFAGRHTPMTPGSYILLSVADTGRGIDPKNREHIFEPFFTTKQVGEGTGLGLATVYGIIKQSGGFIWVYSEMGQGTTFEIYLPRVDRLVAAEEKTGEYEDAPKGVETILVVEDEDIVRALTRSVLEESGYKVIEASNGVEALSIFKENNYKIDLLMTDVVMPHMGGRELAEKLAIIQPRLPVLFTSGYTDDAIIHHKIMERHTNFIQKPFTFDALAHKVRECLDDENKS